MFYPLGILESQIYKRQYLNKILTGVYDNADDPAKCLAVTENSSKYISALRKSASRFKKIVIWGLKSEFHTHRFIHLAFFNTLNECDINVIWVDNKKENNSLINAGDIVFVVGICSDNIEYKKQVYYVLHNVDFHDDTPRPMDEYALSLQVFTSGCLDAGELVSDTVTVYSHKKRILYQAWGTDVAPYRFAPPTAPSDVNRVFWVGSIWDNALNQGNRKEISFLKEKCSSHGIKFIQVFPVSTKTAITHIRNSRLAPAVAGEWQAQAGYLPCRFFKNVSYGRLCFSNVLSFSRIYGESGLIGEDIGELLEFYLRLSEKEILDMTVEQQEVTKEHTYFTKLHNIFTLI